MKQFLVIIICCIAFSSYSQESTKIDIINADITYADEDNPEVVISIGNVFVEINGATLRCDRVEKYSKRNYLKAMGNVVMNQGDTVIQTSDFADYDANKKMVKSWSNVKLTDPSMTLTTDKLYFDRTKQHLYYNEKGTIKDSTNVLNSRIGNYYLETKKFQALTSVVITNPDHIVESNHLDYYTESGSTYLYGPSTITSEESVVYTEKGFTNTNSKISHLTKNSWIQYENRLIEGDSLYNDGNTNFSSATGNIKLTDTINNSIIKGGYAEVFKDHDSAFVIEKPVAISLIEQDSMYIHGDTLLVTGKTEERVIRAYHRVKFFKIDLQGKCDSLVSIQETGLTKMFRKPILWSQENQITGNVIHFLSDSISEQLDSLKVLGNAFMVQKDSIGYNQTKGRDILGKFEDNDLRIVDVMGNGEVLHYVRDEEDELMGISKMKCSNINIELVDSQIQTVTFHVKPDGKTYPEEEIHVRDRLLRDFEWRIDEKPVDKDDIFRYDPKDEAIMIQERIKEREARIQAKKDEEERIAKEKTALRLQQQQDSINAAQQELNPDHIKETPEEKRAKKEAAKRKSENNK